MPGKYIVKAGLVDNPKPEDYQTMVWVSGHGKWHQTRSSMKLVEMPDSQLLEYEVGRRVVTKKYYYESDQEDTED